MNRNLDITYIYENTYKQKMSKLILEDYENKNELKMHKCNNCYILPAKNSAGSPAWGDGGVQMNGKIVPESIIPGAFGGIYDFDESNVYELDRKIIHIPIVKDHWGHFIIDVLCRFWFLSLPEYKDYTITCCVSLKTPEVGGNFLRIFQLLGICDRIKFIDSPVHCRELLIPDYSLGFDRVWNIRYLNVINILLSNVVKTKKYAGKKIYFTRTKFLKSRVYEIGEKQIEKVFKRLGFEILSPENMSVDEQIDCFQNADEIVSLSGTIPHNIVFARDGLKFTILNRQPIIKLPQLRINQMMKNVNVTYVDVYHPVMEKAPKPYGKGAVWVFVSPKLQEFILTKYGLKVKTTSKVKLFEQKIHYHAVNLFDSLWRRG